MPFDPDNKINKLCADGMAAEGRGEIEDASRLFLQAWHEASDDFEKFTAAHFVARHQQNTSDKLKWDKISLEMALKIKDEFIKGSYPSLYLNIGKCHEDLNDFNFAIKNYQLAASYFSFLQDDGYGKMIKSGILAGLDRMKIVSAIRET